MLVAIFHDTPMADSLREALRLTLSTDRWREVNLADQVGYWIGNECFCVTDLRSSDPGASSLVESLLARNVPVLSASEHRLFCLACLVWPRRFLCSPFDLTQQIARNFFHDCMHVAREDQTLCKLQSVADYYVNMLVSLGYLNDRLRDTFASPADQRAFIKASTNIYYELKELERKWRQHEQ